MANKNIGVAVLDTGIYRHIDFDNRIIAFKDFINNRSIPYDDSGHGTHVSGIIAGSGKASNGRFKGIAPMSQIISVKVLDSYGNGRIGSVIDGTNWIINNKDLYNIRVANISFGTTPNNNIDIENTLNLIRHVENMWHNGIVVVAAAGNNGPAAKSITAPGTSHTIITFHSGRGPTKDGFQKPELVVAGSNITACSNRKNGYSTKSGTSMSAPIVSGAIARLLTNHDLTPEEVRSRLKKCCNKVNLPHNQQGWGHLDIIKFITMKT